MFFFVTKIVERNMSFLIVSDTCTLRVIIQIFHLEPCFNNIIVYCCSSPQLKLLFGIVAIGTEQGHCYLLDLRLDDEGEEFDEWLTSPIEVVNPFSHDMAQLRNTARTNGTHLGIEIGGMLKCFRLLFIQNTCMSSFLFDLDPWFIFHNAPMQTKLGNLCCLPNDINIKKFKRNSVTHQRQLGSCLKDPYI